MTISKEWFEHCKKSWYNEGYIDGEYNRDRQFEDSVSEDLEKAAKQYGFYIPTQCEATETWKKETEQHFKDGAKWQLAKIKSITLDDLGEFINELSKQFPEVSFAKVCKIATRTAKWQKEQFEKNRLAHCDALTEEQTQMECDFVVQHVEKNNRTPTFIDAIEYGMRLQKEQIKKAMDLGEPPYLISVEQAYYRTLKLLED